MKHIIWDYNEWQGDGRYDDKFPALIEAVREVACQLEELNIHLRSAELTQQNLKEVI